MEVVGNTTARAPTMEEMSKSAISGRPICADMWRAAANEGNDFFIGNIL